MAGAPRTDGDHRAGRTDRGSDYSFLSTHTAVKSSLQRSRGRLWGMEVAHSQPTTGRRLQFPAANAISRTYPWQQWQ